MQKKRIMVLRRHNFIWLLAREGLAGLRRRGQTVMHLVSNTQHLNLVVRSDYLHLSRSLFAAAGSFASIYSGSRRFSMWRDLVAGIGRFPWIFARDRVDVRIRRVRDSILERIPLPRFRRQREMRLMAERAHALHSAAK
jgi:hypothetical protein